MNERYCEELNKLHDYKEMDSWDGGHRSDYYESYLEVKGYIYRDDWTGETTYIGPTEMGG